MRKAFFNLLVLLFILSSWVFLSGCNNKTESKYSGDEYIYSIFKSIQTNNFDNFINTAVNMDKLKKDATNKCKGSPEFKKQECINVELNFVLHNPIGYYKQSDGKISDHLYKAFPASAKYEIIDKSEAKSVFNGYKKYYIKVTYANPNESVIDDNKVVKEAVYYIMVNKSGEFAYDLAVRIDDID